MGKTVVVGSGSTPNWEWVDKRDGIFTALCNQTIQCLRFPGTGLTLDQLQLVTEHRNPFALETAPAELVEILAIEQEKWHKVFPKGSLDFSGLVAFPRRAGHDWPILVPKRMTNNKLFAACRKKFGCWKYVDNLDIIGPAQSFTTLRWFKKVQEADEDLQKLSANMLLKRGVPCVWLQERLWMELDWFMETREHLDVNSTTLVAGSYDFDACVPRVCFCDGEVRIYRCEPDSRDPDWRTRSAG